MGLDQQESQGTGEMTLQEAIDLVLQDAEKREFARLQDNSEMYNKDLPQATSNPYERINGKEIIEEIRTKLKLVTPDNLSETDITLLRGRTLEGRSAVTSALRSGSLVVTDRVTNTNFEPTRIPGLFLVEETRQHGIESPEINHFLRGEAKLPLVVASMIKQK